MEFPSEVIAYDMENEYRSFWAWFVVSCEEDDYERGLLIWDAMLGFSYIEFTEKETRAFFKMCASKPFASANAQKWFIKAHLSFRKWKNEEAQKETYKGGY